MAFYVKPVIDYGDSVAYIYLSKVFLGEIDMNLSHRSPLFSAIIAVITALSSEPLVYKLVVFYHYILITIGTWLIYKICSTLYNNNWIPVFTALLFNLSLSTLFYANIMLTEITTVFLLLVASYYLVRFNYKPSSLNALIIGFTVGLMVLARFNTTPLIITFAFLLIVSLICQKYSLKNIIMSSGIYLISCGIILNVWFLYNYKTNGFYGLFPNASKAAVSAVSSNALISSINSQNVVIPEHQPILDIYLEARNEYELQKPVHFSGSLVKYDFLNILNALYSGYPIRGLANEKIELYLSAAEDDTDYLKREMAVAGFYKEIKKQNRVYLMNLRFASLFSSFRSSAIQLPSYYGNINTNIFPFVIYKIYKGLFFGISIVVFLLSLNLLYQFIRKKHKFDFVLFTFIIIVFSFYFINFYFNTVNDANRFKFPAEPFIFGLYIYFNYQAYVWFRARKKGISKM